MKGKHIVLIVLFILYFIWGFNSGRNIYKIRYKEKSKEFYDLSTSTIVFLYLTFVILLFVIVGVIGIFWNSKIF